MEVIGFVFGHLQRKRRREDEGGKEEDEAGKEEDEAGNERRTREARRKTTVLVFVIDTQRMCTK